ncbi:MAG: NAD(P)-dependent oxidoreductase [Candidatus Omnitrophica bacterium]|nr:NAD(P)-dependent oxidoreductase [Candidatus Omnitrophota bacterium]
MNVLVTGATGFIGRHLVRELLHHKKYDVFCFVRNPKKAKLLEGLGAQLIYGDITDKKSLAKLKGYKIDLAFHCAAYVENKNIKKLHQVNVQGTRNVCDICLEHRVSRLVYLSSVAVISGNTELPLREDLPFAATNAYGESKIEAEKVALEFRNKGLAITILRPPIVYGEDEPHALKFLLKLLKARLLPLINQGENILHLAYVENVVSAMLFCLESDEFLKGSFFVADKEALRVKDIFKALAKGIGAKPPGRLFKLTELLLLNLPGIGKKISFFLKDRIYSLKRIESLGFKPHFEAKKSLIISAEKLYYGK